MRKERPAMHRIPHINEPYLLKHSLLFLHSLPLKSTKKAEHTESIMKYAICNITHYPFRGLI